MNPPNFAAAKAYALSKLEQELDPQLVYHNLAHTVEDVFPSVERLATMLDVQGEERMLLETATIFHDIGFTVQVTDHEAVGVQIIRKELPRWGYTAAQIEKVADLIMATRVPQTPHNLSAQILCDADLDLLGRDDFWILNGRLRAELAALGTHFTDTQWYEGQIKFLRQHTYFTMAARALRGAQKEAYIDVMENRLLTIAV